MTIDARHIERLARAANLPEGQHPFAWQVELLRRFIEGRDVEAVDVPTGLGKTTVMAIWLVAFAAGAKLPRRLVYVVDRRAVVDQATEIAEGLRRWVAGDAEISRALGLEGRDLPISTLRGQHVDNREWLADPSAPAIILGTVDMIGSRLLFSGYGVSSKMRPYHAGLLGADTLLVLDEAHLSQPFERLLDQLALGTDANGRTLVDDGVVPRFRALSLSATGRVRDAERVVRLSETDLTPGGVVEKRLRATKSLSLRGEIADKELPDALAAEAWAISEQGTAQTRILVFCTSRDHAQKVHEALARRGAKLDAPDPVLFVGGRRAYERELAAKQLRALGFLAGSTERPPHAVFVIATAAGEVGVDLDADHAVCDLVAWERMVQRLGRVNRRGDGSARIVVVPTRSEDEPEQARRDAVQKLLAVLPAKDSIDVSLDALTTLKKRAEREAEVGGLFVAATTPAPLHPPLTRALVESWSMTSLDEHTGRPEVAPWIRGWPDEDEKPQTTLVWRRHLPVRGDGKLFGKRDLSLFRDSAEPHLAERLETETWRVMKWLETRTASLPQHAPEGGGDMLLRHHVVAVILDREAANVVLRGELFPRESRDKDKLARSLAGATVLLDSRIGGLAEGLLAAHSDEHVVDVSEVDVPRVVPFRVLRVDDDASTTDTRFRTELRVNLVDDDASPSWLVVESLVSAVAESEDGRSGAMHAQLLDAHQAWTEEEMQSIGQRLQLSDPLLEALCAAARLHDEGKKARRWQQAFHTPNGGNPPYAKSATKRPNIAYLEGYRHELGSLPYAEAHARVMALSPEFRDLCLHVIAAHHGYARPLIRTTGADEPPSRLAHRAREIVSRFARLEDRWGPWGLAWCESLLRAADQRASRRNDVGGGEGG
ncbi:type I-U CRISPR-associated helicase/endonuclease Cas3 [soil metagenome]